jgi:hypothetical protein
MRVSPFISAESTLFEGSEPSEPKEDDSEDFCENDRPSSPLIEFEPLHAGPTSIFRDETLERGNSWATELYEELTLESREKDPLDEHGNFILERPQEPCSHNAFLESATLCAVSTHKDYNHPKVLHCKMFRRMVVDAFVCHKHCKFHGHTAALTLQLEQR